MAPYTVTARLPLLSLPSDAIALNIGSRSRRDHSFCAGSKPVVVRLRRTMCRLKDEPKKSGSDSGSTAAMVPTTVPTPPATEAPTDSSEAHEGGEEQTHPP